MQSSTSSYIDLYTLSKYILFNMQKSDKNIYIYSESYGNGESILFFHGFLASSRHYQSFARQLSENYRITLPDLPNHGNSMRQDECSYKSMAITMSQWIKTHCQLPLILAGHSMGGKLAMKMVLDQPDQYKALIVLDISPLGHSPELIPSLSPLINLPIDKINRRAEADRILKPYVPDGALRSFYLTNLERNDNGQFQWMVPLKTLDKSRQEIARGIDLHQIFDKPALFLRGETSPYFKKKDEEAIKKAFPLARFVEIKNAGHWIHHEAPEECHQAIDDFLSQNL